MRVTTALALLGLLAGANAATVADYYAGYKGQGYAYGGKYDSGVPYNKYGGFYQKPMVVCPDQYALWEHVTAIRVCKDQNNIITGIQYFNEHPTKHYDPVTVCITDGMPSCEVYKFPIDPSNGEPLVVTNIKVAKFEDGSDKNGDWKIVYINLGFADGSALEIGHLNTDYLESLKVYQWYTEHIPGKVCGLNGFYRYGLVCDKDTGYLTFMKPCFSCDKKPKAPKGDKYKVVKYYESYPGYSTYYPGKDKPSEPTYPYAHSDKAPAAAAARMEVGRVRGQQPRQQQQQQRRQQPRPHLGH